jgi:GTP-binding protein
VDSRHGIKEIDRPSMAMLDAAGVSYQIVLTKIDKVGGADLARVVDRVAAELAAHSAAHVEVYLTSAVERRGIAELQETLGALASSVA